MTDVSTPQAAEDATPGESPSAQPLVRVVVTHVEGSDLEVAMATITRQVYGRIETVVVVAREETAIPSGYAKVGSLEEAISSTGHDVEYLWIVQSDTRPRPDALGALVFETERSHASLAGSKVLVAGTPGQLESIGGATDVFGEPYSGLDEGEIDLQQYDVVREVAFVSSVSLLVRRDLAQGLRGLDHRLPPGAAGLDFSQRVRLAGGRVLIVPSSEVYHQSLGRKIPEWREQAGRYRAMLKAYRLLTLAWVVPFGLIVGLLDALAGLLTLNWRPGVRFLAATCWNLIHLPSTVVERYRFRKVRSVGDEELFRFQARGSIKLRSLGSDLGDRLLFMFDDDQALVKGSRRIWSSPGIWGAVFAILVLTFGARSILFNGMPNSGFNFPFEEGLTALDRFFGGWNEAGLGSSSSVHPAIGPTGLASVAWFGAEGAARTLLTLGFAGLGVAGMGRLAGRLGYRGPGRYLAGLILMAGPGTTLATGEGSWLAFAGAALLPWAVRSVFVYRRRDRALTVARIGAVVMWSLLLGSFTPVLVVVPPFFAVVWRLIGERRARMSLAMISIIGILAPAAFLIDNLDWIFDSDRRLTLSVFWVWPILVAVATVALAFVKDRARDLAAVGAAVALGSIIAINLDGTGPGMQEALLVLASFGTALVATAALNVLSGAPLRAIAALAAAIMLVYSIGQLSDGRLGLRPGDDVERLEFASTLAGAGGPGRVLYISSDPGSIPGEARPGPGLWYRPVDGAGTTLDEVWLPNPEAGDDELAAVVQRVASGAELRPGAQLAPFAFDFVVVDSGPDYLEEILGAQFDLVPQPLESDSLVFNNPLAVPMAVNAFDIWSRDGADFVGDATTGRTLISMNFSDGWAPSVGESGWSVSVSAESGRATYKASGLRRDLPLAVAILFVVALLAIAAGRFRR